MQLQIRLAQSEDMPHILALQAHSLRSLSQSHYSREQIEALVRSQAEVRMQSFEAGEELIYVGEVAMDESSLQIVAMSALLIGQAQIGAVYVHPDFVRQGIARQLVEVLEAKARELNYRILYVISSLAAVLFYRSMGYRHIGKTCIMAENYAIGCVNMAKSLTGDGKAFQGNRIRTHQDNQGRENQGLIVWFGIILCLAFTIALAIALAL
jgi:putative acetyltransferase